MGQAASSALLAYTREHLFQKFLVQHNGAVSMGEIEEAVDRRMLDLRGYSEASLAELLMRELRPQQFYRV